MKTSQIGTTNSYCGIDYSMTSPCICIWSDDLYKFYFLTPTKKMPTHFIQDNMLFFGKYNDIEYIDDIDRFDQITSWCLSIIEENRVDYVMLEDYSFASTGRTFQIGENFGLLKYKLRCSKIPFKTVPPTVLKKFATGKGNAKKLDLQTKFIQQTGVHIKRLLDMTENQWNPSSDIVDAYFLVNYMRENNEN